jgi:uncharacterized SAM-binding protein YcdF (DUF218 family)
MWDLLFYPGKVATALLLPPMGFVWLALLALLFIRRWPRTAIVTLWLSCVSLIVLALPSVASGLLASMNPQRMDDKLAKTADAVMILGGGLRRATPEYGDTLSQHALERTRYGAKLAKELNLPVLVTGGQVYGGTPEADVMAGVLKEYGVNARWVENRSRHTRENAIFSQAMLKEDKVQRVLLVTHDYHMRRSMAHCEAAGLICLPAPVTSRSKASDSWVEQLPNASALRDSGQYIHEIVGIVVMQWL